MLLTACTGTSENTADTDSDTPFELHWHPLTSHVTCLRWSLRWSSN